jgi:8-oxo-dGTP pyrophosphatase MutT (NUDIX family)
MKQVTLLFLVQGDEILLAMKKRGFGEGRWNGCGGKVEPSETIEQAMIRETQEEIGVTPIIYEKMAIHDFIMEDHEDFEAHTYVCTEWEGGPVETEEMAPQWFAKNAVPFDQMWQDDIVWLPAVLRGKKLKTRFTFDAQNNMTSAQLTFVTSLP